jgi:hypothetical protein
VDRWCDWPVFVSRSPLVLPDTALTKAGQRLDLLREDGLLRNGRLLGDAVRMSRARGLPSDGDVRGALGHGLGAARAREAEGRDAAEQGRVVRVLDHPARMQRTQGVRTFLDKSCASSLTPQTDFPDDTGHRFPDGHATLSLVLAE